MPGTSRSSSASQVILLVEDDPSVRHLATRVLERTGYTVRAARDAYEALTLTDATCSGIDLVVSDVRMPGPSGLEALALLRDTLRASAILVVTAFPDVMVKRDAFAVGAVDVLEKPFELDELRDAAVRLVTGGVKKRDTVAP